MATNLTEIITKNIMDKILLCSSALLNNETIRLISKDGDTIVNRKPLDNMINATCALQKGVYDNIIESIIADIETSKDTDVIRVNVLKYLPVDLYVKCITEIESIQNYYAIDMTKREELTLTDDMDKVKSIIKNCIKSKSNRLAQSLDIQDEENYRLNLISLIFPSISLMIIILIILLGLLAVYHLRNKLI